MVASFAPDQSVSDIPFECYLRKALLVPSAELEALGAAVRQETRLKHLNSLVRLLQRVANVDPLEQVRHPHSIPPTTRTCVFVQRKARARG
jgi:hypothetical protein